MNQAIFPPVSVKYFNTLIDAMKCMSSDLIINPDHNHAEAALICLYSSAKKSVKILSGDMERAGGHSQKMIESWNKIVNDPQIEVEILLEEGTSHDSFRLNYASKMKAFNNKITYLDTHRYEDFCKKNNNSNPIHFTIIDDISYRYEYNTTDHKAYLCFSDQKMAGKLATKFNELKM